MHFLNARGGIAFDNNIDIRQAAPAVMGPLIGSVQQWRFRPATESGQAVSSRFSTHACGPWDMGVDF